MVGTRDKISKTRNFTVSFEIFRYLLLDRFVQVVIIIQIDKAPEDMPKQFLRYCIQILPMLDNQEINFEYRIHLVQVSSFYLAD